MAATSPGACFFKAIARKALCKSASFILAATSWAGGKWADDKRAGGK